MRKLLLVTSLLLMSFTLAIGQNASDRGKIEKAKVPQTEKRDARPDKKDMTDLSEKEKDQFSSKPLDVTYTKKSIDLTSKAVIFTDGFEHGGSSGDWENDPTNDNDWDFLTSTTNSGGTIPGDNTTGTGYFAYFNSWSAGNGDVGLLNSPTIDLSGTTNARLDFAWNRPRDGYTARLEVNIYADGTWNNDVYAGLDYQTAGWEIVTVDLAAYAFNDVVVQFKVVGDWYRNIGLDDVVVYEPEPYEFSLTYPEGVYVNAGESHDYQVTITNTGTSNDDFTPAIDGDGTWTYDLYQADGTTPQVDAIAIAAGEAADFIIRVDVPASAAFNDTDTESFTVTSAEGAKAVEAFSITTTALAPMPLPVYEGFEEGNTDDQAVTSWDMVNVSGTIGWKANSTQTDKGRAPRTGDFNAYLRYSNTAWLFTKAPIELEAAKLYRFSVYARQDGATAANASITLKYGAAATDEGMTHVVKELTGVVDGDYQLVEGEFSPEVDGVYYLGILGAINGTPWYLSIDDIAITEVFDNDASVSQLVTPSGNMFQGNTYPVSVTVTNEGTNPQPAGVSVTFKEEGVEFATAATTVDLAMGESEVVTANYTPTAVGTFAIEASIAADENTANDMVTGLVTIFPAGALFEDFEGDFLPAGWAQTVYENSWTQEDRDINGLSAFLIHDASSAEEMLLTPKLTLDGSVNELSYWADDGNGGLGYGDAQIQVKYSANRIDWTNVGDTATLDAGAPAQFTVDLSDIPHGDYYFAFAASSTFELAGYNSLTAIDDVTGPVIADVLANDLSIAVLDYPREFTYDGDTLSVFVKVDNVGTDVQTGVELTFSVNGVDEDTHTLGSIGFGQSEIVEFTHIAVAGRHTFTTTLAADDNLDNNARTTQGVVVAEGQLAEGFEGAWPPDFWEAEADWRYWDQTWTSQWEGVRAAACGNSLGFSNSKLITPLLQIGANEELNFYATVGNEIEDSPTTIQVMYSADNEEWAEIGDLIELTDRMELYTIDLSALTGNYYLAFAASGAASGSTWATWAVIDHVVGPATVPLHEVTINTTDQDEASLSGVTVTYEGIVSGSVTVFGTTQVLLPDGTYTYTATKEDYYETTGTIVVDGEAVTEDIQLSLYPLVTFSVNDDAASPIADATITVTGYNAITTDAAGEATIRLPNGEHTGTAYKIGFSEYPVTFTVADDADMTVEITLTAAPPTLEVDLTEYQFPVTGVNTSSAAKVFTIQNIGDGTLTINPENITITGDGAAYFDLTTLSEQANLTVGQTATFSVIFSPTVEGVLSAVIEIEDNQAKGVTEIAISGESVDPTINVFTYLETFEGETFPAVGWTVYQQGAVAKQWESSTSYNHTNDGSKSARHMYGSGDHDGWLVMPAIEVPTDGAYKLSFWSRNVYPNDYEKNSVQISTGSSDPSSTDYAEVWSPTTVEAAWVQTTIELTPYAGETIYVAFRYEGNYAHTWHIDDVTIGEFYTLTLNVSPSEEPPVGVLTGAGSYLAGEVVAVKAVATKGYQFINWTDASDQVVSTEAAFSYTVDADATLTAHFAAIHDVTFIVTDGEGPVVGAAVAINELEMGFINAVGTLVVSLPDGTHDYTVTADGFGNATGQLTVDGDAVTVNVTMIPVYEVTFSVVGENGTLTALANSTDISSGDLVLEGSDVEFTATPDESYRVKEWKFNDVVVDENTTNSYTVSNLMAAANVTVEFELIPTYTVTLTVVDGETPLEGATITFNGVDYTTGADGIVIIADLVDGTYAYTVTMTGYDDVAGEIVVDGADVAETIELTLTTYTVTLTVVESENATPVEGATVTFDEVDYTTDVDGIVAITDLVDGTYAYTVTMDEYDDTTGEIVVEGADVEETIELVLTGIDSELFSNLKVYPNPFSDKITIKNGDRVNRVIVTNIVGQRVMDINLNGLETIDTSELTNGVYLVTFEGANGERAVRKMIKK
ncbi:MAG: choice-of-anchor J domain-containing protein [Bacteroidales bacterium]|nr:choice-of-anchor J domain-containing protein [Bacteroidales bacterium]